MKRIIVDYLRRRGWDYLFGILFVGMIDLMWMAQGKDAHGSFAFVCLFMLPLLLDQKGGHTGVIVTLPISRRTTALYYWGIAVFLPVLAVAGTFALASLLSACFFSTPFSAILLTSFAAVVVASLIWAGASCCIFTCFSPMAPEDVNYFAQSWMLLWFAAFLFGIFYPDLFDITKQSPVVWLGAGLLGLLLTFWGCLRSEKLVTGRTRKRPGSGQYSTQAPTRIPPFKPGMARFGGVFFEVGRSGLLFGLLFPAFFFIFKMRIRENDFIWRFLFVFGAIAYTGFLRGGMRLLRSLPLSAGRLALTLLLMPLFGILGMIAGVAIIQWISPGHFLIHYSASFLICMAGAMCAAFSLMVRFGGIGYVLAMALAMPASVVIFESVSNVNWPAAFWWLLGLCLMAAAFFLNRHWLRCSASYRASTGPFQRR